MPVSTDADNEATANTMPIDGAVHLRVAFDLVAIERDANGAPGQTRRIFYNTRVVAMEPEMARVTLELTHWALERAGRPTPMSNLELVDLTADRVYHVTRRRARTIERTRATAAMIEALWPTL